MRSVQNHLPTPVHTLKRLQNEKLRNWERRSNTLQQEHETMQHELKSTKQQLRECQELYTTREIQHKQELQKSRIDLQATEVQNYLRQEIQRKEEIQRTELAHQQEKSVHRRAFH